MEDKKHKGRPRDAIDTPLMMNDPDNSFHFIENDSVLSMLGKRGAKTNADSLPLLFIVILSVAYLPVLLLSVFEGTFSQHVTITFMKDFGFQFRFLVAVPILIFSRPVIRKATSKTCNYIHDILLDKEDNENLLLPAIARIRELNESRKIKIVIVVVVVAITVLLHFFIVQNDTLTSSSGWFGSMQNDRFRFSKAYLWYSLVSMLIFRFLIARWFWNYGTWVWLLLKVARCKLKLTPHHGDKACGLNMLFFPQTRFNMFFVAMAITSSGMFINNVLYRHAVFNEVLLEIVILVSASFIMLLGPYFFFVGKLFQAKIATQISMNSKSQQLSEDYDQEWIRTKARGVNEEQPDPSVMIDFYSTYEITEKIRPFCFSLTNVISLVIPIALAFLPTVLTRMSLKELFEVVMRFLV